MHFFHSIKLPLMLFTATIGNIDTTGKAGTAEISLSFKLLYMQQSEKEDF